MKSDFNKTILITIIIAIIFILASVYIQLTATSKLEVQCSYFDPITVDILAFIGASFLIVEGFIRISANKNKPFKTQLSRMLRISLGFSTLTFHLVQFYFK